MSKRPETMAAAPARTRARLFIATSADGFIAREDGAIDCLERAHAGASPREDFGDQAFFDSVDALVMGRQTFELARGFDPWPYGDKPVVLPTRQGLEVPPALRATGELEHRGTARTARTAGRAGPAQRLPRRRPRGAIVAARGAGRRTDRHRRSGADRQRAAAVRAAAGRRVAGADRVAGVRRRVRAET